MAYIEEAAPLGTSTAFGFRRLLKGAPVPHHRMSDQSRGPS